MRDAEKRAPGRLKRKACRKAVKAVLKAAKRNGEASAPSAWGIVGRTSISTLWLKGRCNACRRCPDMVD